MLNLSARWARDFLSVLLPFDASMATSDERRARVERDPLKEED